MAQTQVNQSYVKPTKTGHYWIGYYNPTTGLLNSLPEVVYVAFDVSFRRKKVNRVIGRFWQCNLEDITNAFWSDEITPPNFPK